MSRVSTALVALLLCGCGGRFHIVAPNVEHPVSASPVIFGSKLERLEVPRDLEIVHHFAYDEYHWSMLWSVLPLSDSEHDLSERLTEEIRAAGGDAVINLTVTAQSTLLFNMLGIVPVFPTLARAHVEGDVVRRVTPAAVP